MSPTNGSIPENEHNNLLQLIHGNMHKLSKQLSMKYNSFLVDFHKKFYVSCAFDTKDIAKELENAKTMLEQFKAVEDKLIDFEINLNVEDIQNYRKIIFVPTLLSGVSIITNSIVCKLLLLVGSGIYVGFSMRHISTFGIQTVMINTIRTLISKIKIYLDMQIENISNGTDLPLMISTHHQLYLYCFSVRKIGLNLPYYDKPICFQ